MEIALSKYYHLPLLPPWEDLAYDCQVIATVNKDTISEIDDFNIRNTFFVPKGIGVATYLATVRPETPIHMVHLFKQKDPFEMNTEIKIFLPDSIIDHSKVFEYRIGKKIKFDVNLGGFRYFQNQIAEHQFSIAAETELVKAIGNTENFIADIASASYSSNDILLTDEEIKNFEDTVKRMLEFKRSAIIQEKANNESLRMDLYLQRLRSEEAERKAAEALAQYHEAINGLTERQIAVQEEALILNNCKVIMTEMLRRLESGEMQVSDITNFQTIYNQVRDTMN